MHSIQLGLPGEQRTIHPTLTSTPQTHLWGLVAIFLVLGSRVKAHLPPEDPYFSCHHLAFLWWNCEFYPINSPTYIFNSFILIHSFIPFNCKDITKYLFQSIGKPAHFISSSTLLLWLNGRLACLTYFLLFGIINSFRLWNVPSWMQEEPSVAIGVLWLMLRTCINFLG